MGQALSLEEASEEVVQAPRVITRAKLSPCQPLPLPIPPARRAPSTDAIALPGKQQTQPQQPQQQAPQVLQSEMRDNLKAILNATSSIQEQRIRAVVKQIEERNITPLPVFSLALSAASARHGLRVVLRRITNTKQYWAGSKGSAFLLCIPAGVNTISSETLIVDPGFRTLFETPRMTPRYR